MRINARALIGGAFFAGSVAGIAYSIYAITRLKNFERRMRAPRAAYAPPITMLKPLHGDEPDLYENLRSFCDQQYEQYNVVFGAADENDPALDVARRLQQEFAHVDITIAAGNPGRARNPKVANLLGMAHAIKHEIVVLADSDMIVGPDYLQAIGAVFADPQIGAATCIFCGVPNEALASRVGALAITDEFCPSVLVAESLAPVDFCMGATVAIRRSVLAEIGGFEAIGEHLADDYEIGQRTHKAGHRLIIAPYAVATAVPERTLRAIWEHEVRWSRTVFLARPSGFAGTIVMHTAILAAAALAVRGPRPPYVALMAASLATRSWLHFTAGRILAPRVPMAVHLLPVRIVLSFGVWCAAFLGRRVGWRGEQLTVNAEGRLLDGA